MTHITLLTKNNCPQCKGNKMFLDAKKIPYDEKNIDENEAYRLEALATGFKSAPIVIPDPSSGIAPWSGFRPNELKKLL